MDGQINMFVLIALEKDISHEAVPDDIMSIIKGACSASHLHEDQRRNDYTGEIFKSCAGKTLTAEQIAAGIKPCTLRHNKRFGDKKSCLDYMTIGANKGGMCYDEKVRGRNETSPRRGAR